MAQLTDSTAYWRGRQNLIYYQVVRALVEDLGKDAESLLDVGSAGCPYLDWYPHIPQRVSVDPDTPYDGAGVTAVQADFLQWEPGQCFDVVTCLQVLEHVPRPDLFARKLLAAGRVVIVSVPHDWPPESVSDHLHDPITERKMRRWFSREPNFSYVCREVLNHSDRLIQVYEPSPHIWSNLAKRRLLPATHSVESPTTRARILRRIRKSPAARWLSRQRRGLRRRRPRS